MNNLSFSEWFGIIGSFVGIWGFVRSSTFKKTLLETEKVRRQEYENRESLRKELCQRCNSRYDDMFSYFDKKKEMV